MLAEHHLYRHLQQHQKQQDLFCNMAAPVTTVATAYPDFFSYALLPLRVLAQVVHEEAHGVCCCLMASYQKVDKLTKQHVLAHIQTVCWRLVVNQRRQQTVTQLAPVEKNTY